MRSTSCFVYGFLLQVINEKTLCSKDKSEGDFSHKVAFVSLLFFRKNQKQESNFQQVSGLVMRNISAFCLK